jgi:hypothetical protein
MPYAQRPVTYFAGIVYPTPSGPLSIKICSVLNLLWKFSSIFKGAQTRNLTARLNIVLDKYSVTGCENCGAIRE